MNLNLLSATDEIHNELAGSSETSPVLHAMCNALTSDVTAFINITQRKLAQSCTTSVVHLGWDMSKDD